MLVGGQGRAPTALPRRKRSGVHSLTHVVCISDVSYPTFPDLSGGPTAFIEVSYPALANLSR
jgi:hypothetical protein